MSKITVMYGKNGRGKSTVAQSLLLLAQSMRQTGTLNWLSLKGDFVNIGGFYDVVNSSLNAKSFGINLTTDIHGCEMVKMSFCDVDVYSQKAVLTDMFVNGVDRFASISSSKDDLEHGEVTKRYLLPTSDVSIMESLKDTLYVSADRLGPQNFSDKMESLYSDFLKPNGSNLLNVLDTQGEEFVKTVGTALSFVLSGASINVRTDIERVELRLNSVDGDTTYKPQNVGFGYSYVLPVIVSALLAKPHSLLIIENPEAHLHPGAQSRVVEFLSKLAIEKDLQIIIETHSDHIINGLRISVKRETISSNSVSVLYFDRSGDHDASCVPIKMDHNGTFDNEPEDFMDEWTKQMIALL